MSHIAYFRVSTQSQSIDAQKAAIEKSHKIDRAFSDEGVSGSVLAASRPGFAEMLKYVREGDVIHVYAVDRLGRDAIDVQATIRTLLLKGVTVEIEGLGQIGRGVGELIVSVLSQVADMERTRINERTASGREVAKATFAATGRTHKGKDSIGGRPVKADPQTVKVWRAENDKSIAATAEHFGLSEATVKRYCKAV